MKLIQYYIKLSYQEEEIEFFGVFKDDESFERFRKEEYHLIRRGADKELTDAQFAAFKKAMEAK